MTSVGGSGLGVLSPHDPTNYGDGPGSEPVRAAFEEKTTAELADWAAKRGRWMYV